MTDVRGFTPVMEETLPRVRVRFDSDANAGLSSDDPDWRDTREGSFYWDMTQPVALEFARVWDAFATEVAAVAFPVTAWGEYLDMHAATFGMVRNPAVPAVGAVMFVGEPDTLIATGVEVSASPSDPSFDAVTFRTTETGTTIDSIGAPTGVGAVPSASGGHMIAGSYVYNVTAYNEFGETLPGADAGATVVTNGYVTITWSAVAGALGYRVYRGGQLLADTNMDTYLDSGEVAPGVPMPTEDTTSGVLLAVAAAQAGTVGNLSAGAITTLDTLIPGITLVTNPGGTSGGVDVEDDDALRLRVLAQYSGQGAGNQQDYVRWSLAYPGVERAVCVPVWDGPQTVLVIVMLEDGSPVSSAVVTGLQALLDPLAAMGVGQAPIGAIVTVQTTVPLDVAFSAVLTFAPGYSLDGLAGTIATRAEIESALQAYLLSLNPGDSIIYQEAQAKFFTVDGVRNVGSFTINGGTANVPLTASPAQYPHMLTPTLS